MSRTAQKLTRSYLHVPRKTPLLGKTCGQSFIEMAAKNPDKEMYVFYADKERKTYKQMQEESQQFAGALLKLGIKNGDTLGVWGGNHYEWLLAYLAAFQIGVITVHMRIDFPLDVQQKILTKLGIRVLVLMRSPSDLCDKACQIIPEFLTNPADKLNCKSAPMLKYVINAGSKICRGTFSLPEFMDIGKEVDKAKVVEACKNVDYDDEIGVFFTSGSTGFPKGVTLTHKSLSVYPEVMDGMSEDADGNPISWTSRYLVIMSFGGLGAQLGAVMPVFKTSTTIIVGPTYDHIMLAKAIQDERATGTFMLIHHLNDILNLPDFKDYDFSSLQLCLCGGSTIPSSLREKAKKITKHVLLEYDGTEVYFASQTPKHPIELLEAPAYYLDEGQEIKIIGDDNQIQPINTPGEICFRSGYLFAYYWGEEEKTKAAKRSSGWYHTGDLGTLDENGYLRIIGRKAEMIIKGGINIAPGDLEKVLDRHPAVHNVMVVGVPDERTSEEVCACIRLHLAAKVIPDELKEFCKGKVSDFLVPKYVLFFEAAFPVTETGKFDRRKITEQAKRILAL